MKPTDPLLVLGALTQRPRRGCRRFLTGCMLLLVMLFLLGCGLLAFLFLPRQAEAAPQQPAPPPLAVWLLIDNSNSMFEKGGAGSDPDLLRIAAARLFIAYLGVDERDLIHRVGVIFFGTTAETAVPLTPLHSDTQRNEMAAAIADPPRMGWTDPLAALTLAQAHMDVASKAQRPAIVLLTDGKPEAGSTAAPTDQETLRALRRAGDDLAAAGIPLFIILLANETTDADAAIAALWRPLWAELSAATPTGRFFEARTAADLPGIYHDIVITLTGNQTAGAILDADVPAAGLTQTLPVADNLAQMTLVISKASPEQEITILTTGGEPLVEGTSTVRRAGQPGLDREEIWVIEQPAPGAWTIRIDGPGPLTIWQDFDPAPPLPATIPPPRTATATAAPTTTPAPLSTATPTATPLLLALQITPHPDAASGPAADKPAKAAIPPATAATPSALLWRGLLAALLLAGGGAFSLYRWQRRQRPQLSGQLRLLGAPTALPLLVDLDRQARPRLTIGRPPADVPLPGALSQATLCTGAPLDDTWEVWLQGPSEALLNGLPVLHDMPLTDTAVLDFGSGIQARYENLRLRRAQRSFRQRPAPTH